MNFAAYRDLASISFVRCTSPIPGTKTCAEGVGFSLRSAQEKCRSESIERSYFISLPEATQKRVLGIAAHPNKEGAAEHAWNESLESIFFEKLQKREVVFGHSVEAGSWGTLFLAKIDDKWIVILKFSHLGGQAIVQAVSSRLPTALLRAWVELRNIKIYRPSVHGLAQYTKGNALLGVINPEIRLNPGFQNNPVSKGGIQQYDEKIGTHFITYFAKEEP